MTKRNRVNDVTAPRGSHNPHFSPCPECGLHHQRCTDPLDRTVQYAGFAQRGQKVVRRNGGHRRRRGARR